MNKKQFKEEITGEKKPQLSLYEMVGLNVNPYPEPTLDQYKARCEGMTFSDLQDHAVHVGVVPIDDKEKLVDRLARQYTITTGQLQANAIQREEAEEAMRNSKKKSHLSKEVQKQVSDLLSRGR